MTCSILTPGEAVGLSAAAEELLLEKSVAVLLGEACKGSSRRAAWLREPYWRSCTEEVKRRAQDSLAEVRRMRKALRVFGPSSMDGASISRPAQQQDSCPNSAVSSILCLQRSALK